MVRETIFSRGLAPCRRLRLQALDRVQEPVPRLGAGHVAFVEQLIGAQEKGPHNWRV
jgi:hypothetical protein